jgi:hypothetical protein
MRQPDDTKTGEICAMDLAGPVPARPTAKELAAARAASYKERHNVVALTIQLPAALHAEFVAFVADKGKGKSKSDIIAKLIASQLLRKR